VALRNLRPEDVDAVIEQFERGGVREECAAFLCVRALLKGRDGLLSLTADQRSRCLAAVESKAKAFLFLERQPSEWLGVAVVVVWCSVSPDAPDTLVRLDIGGLGDLRRRVISLMSYMARDRPDVRAALDHLAVQRPELSKVVEDELEMAGIIHEERLALWSRRWRDDRDPQALALIYNRYIENHGASLGVDDIRRVLGDAPLPGRGDITFKAGDGSVYLEFNSSGRLTGWHAT